ncbi:uncharacterized protein LOC142644220 [Castanea sativa]|uniref:uncharacterized protein LOC142644220 n=1 Tax=Castanea sativa TaxID=21020 RepID=UPI003F64C793
MAAREVIGKGMRWNIGNGKKVNIWTDKWIPNPDSFEIVSPRPPDTTNELVASLINPDIGGWDITTMKRIFLPHDIEAILSIPISPCLPKDTQIWTWTQNGHFTVRSAYYVARKWLMEGNHKADRGCASNSRKSRELWRSIWGMQCQNRVKQWRACKNILPTNYNLKISKVAIEDKCELCGISESSGHVQWDCKLAVDVWKETRLKLPRFQNPQRDFIDVVWRLRDARSELDWDCFATTAWCLRRNRNSVKFEGRCKEAKAIAREVNVDGAIFKELNSCGIGIVIRNDKGQIMGAMSKMLDQPLDALEVEANAVEEGVLLAKDLGLRYIIIEGDALMVMAALSGHTSPPSSIQHIIAGAQLWALSFSAWKSTHVRRNCNQAAHLMARNAKSLFECIIWVEDTPYY